MTSKTDRELLDSLHGDEEKLKEVKTRAAIIILCIFLLIIAASIAIGAITQLWIGVVFFLVATSLFIIWNQIKVLKQKNPDQ